MIALAPITYKDQYVAAYSSKYQGFEFIYLVTKQDKILLFENRLALHGVWLNDLNISKIVQVYIDQQLTFNKTGKQVFTEQDYIQVESYKHRGIGIYDESGFLSKQTPDVTREIKITETK